MTKQLTQAELDELNSLLDVGDKEGMRAFWCARGVHTHLNGRCLDCKAPEQAEG